MAERVLFLCTHNSARSQMAEGMLAAWGGDAFQAFSAGTTATAVQPLAVEVMTELGIDIAHHRSKSLETFVGQAFDYVITVCDEAAEACPSFPGAKQQLHWSFMDPSAATGSESERRAVFQRVRDEIAASVRSFIDERGGRER